MRCRWKEAFPPQNPSTSQSCKKSRYHAVHFSPTIVTQILITETWQWCHIIEDRPTSDVRVIFLVPPSRFYHKSTSYTVHPIWYLKILLRLRASYHHNTIEFAYCLRWYLRRGTTYMYSSLGCTLLASMNHPIHLKHTYDMHKKYRVLLPPTQTLYCVPTNPTTFETTPNDRDNNIYEICTVLAHWCTSVVWSVSIRMREIFRLVTIVI